MTVTPRAQHAASPVRHDSARGVAPWNTVRGPQIDVDGLRHLANSRPDWIFEGACVNYLGVIDFYPDSTERAELDKARTACREECPVVGQCLAYALAHDERDGVWGGTSPYERTKLRTATSASIIEPIELPEHLLNASITKQVVELTVAGHGQAAIALTLGITVRKVQRRMAEYRRGQVR